MPYETIIKEIGPVESKTLIKIFNKLDEKINMVDKLVTKIMK